MITYYLSRQLDGQIILDREILGEILCSVEVSDPPTIIKKIDDELVEVTQYCVSYAEAREKIDTSGMKYISGKGWIMDDQPRQSLW